MPGSAAIPGGPTGILDSDGREVSDEDAGLELRSELRVLQPNEAPPLV